MPQEQDEEILRQQQQQEASSADDSEMSSKEPFSLEKTLARLKECQEDGGILIRPFMQAYQEYAKVINPRSSCSVEKFNSPGLTCFFLLCKNVELSSFGSWAKCSASW